MEPTLQSAGLPGVSDVEPDTSGNETVTLTTPSDPTAMSNRLELVAALLASVVGLEVLALIVGAWGGGPYRSVGDRIEVLSLNLDARMALILLVAAMLATLRDVVKGDFRAPESKLGRRTLIAVAALAVIVAVLGLIGVGLDMARGDVTAFGTNAAAAVIHRLAIVLMGLIAAGWSLTALGVRITTVSRS